jgi:hypothetical protein
MIYRQSTAVVGFTHGKGGVRFSFDFSQTRCFSTPATEGERRSRTSDGPNGAAVDDELSAVDRGGAIGGQVGDEVSDLIGLGRTPDRDPA